MDNQNRRTHPMILVAAAAVTIASLTAVASIAGWIPTANSNVATPPAQATIVTAEAPPPPLPPSMDKASTKPAVTEKVPTPVAHPVRKKLAKQVETSHSPTPDRGYAPATHADNTYQQTQPQQPAAVCHDCATVESVREVKQDGQGSGLGAVGGGVVGGLLGNQIGGGRGKTVGAIVGAVGGAFAGNQVEKKVRSTTNYEIAVRLDDGNTRVFSEAQPPALQRGDRVRIDNGQLTRM